MGDKKEYNREKTEGLQKLIVKECFYDALRLIDDGADPNVFDSKGNSPLHFAVQLKDLGKIEIVRMLLEKGAKPNVSNDNGDTPLHFAVQLEDPDKNKIVLMLLEKGADTSALNDSGHSPFYLAGPDDKTLRVILDHKNEIIPTVDVITNYLQQREEGNIDLKGGFPCIVL